MKLLYIFIFQTFPHYRLEGKTFSLLQAPLKGHLFLAPSHCVMHTTFKNGLSGEKKNVDAN